MFDCYDTWNRKLICTTWGCGWLYLRIFSQEYCSDRAPQKLFAILSPSNSLSFTFIGTYVWRVMAILIFCKSTAMQRGAWNSFVERKRKDARKTALTQNCIGPKYHNCKVNTDFTSWWYSQARQCVCGHVNSFGHSCLWNPFIVDVYGHFHDLRVVAGLMLRHTFEYHRSPNRRPYSTGIRGPSCNWRYLKWSRRNGKNDP